MPYTTSTRHNAGWKQKLATHWAHGTCCHASTQTHNTGCAPGHGGNPHSSCPALLQTNRPINQVTMASLASQSHCLTTLGSAPATQAPATSPPRPPCTTNMLWKAQKQPAPHQPCGTIQHKKTPNYLTQLKTFETITKQQKQHPSLCTNSQPKSKPPATTMHRSNAQSMLQMQMLLMPPDMGHWHAAERACQHHMRACMRQASNKVGLYIKSAVPSCGDSGVWSNTNCPASSQCYIIGCFPSM